jgi:pilus assembly protein Flp/PilA
MPFSPPFAATREANGWSDRSPAPQPRRRRDGFNKTSKNWSLFVFPELHVVPFSSKGDFMIRKLVRDRKGQGLVEYALLVAGIAIISLAAISTLGHKTSDLMAAAAMMIPGAHQGDNAPITSGHLVETDAQGGLTGNAIEVSSTQILANNGTDRLGTNLFGAQSPGAANGLGGLIIESQ